MPKATKKVITQTKKNEPVHRMFTGMVVGTSMNKTITVQVDRMKLNQKYQKKFSVSKKYHVHDETNKAKVGETVQFVECRPISKTKRWRLVETKNKK